MDGTAVPKPKLTDRQQKVVDVLRQMGALDETRSRTADDVMKVGKLPKGQLLATVEELERMGLVGRAKSHKAHRYFVKAR